MYIPAPVGAYAYRRGHYCFILGRKVYQSLIVKNERRIRFHAFLIMYRQFRDRLPRIENTFWAVIFL